MATRTYFQGSFRVTKAATIRVTYHPATTSDWAVSAGDTYTSLDLLIAAWQAQLDSDLGADKVIVSVTHSTTAYTGTLRLTTDGPNVSVDWSQAGDGEDLRDWLGESADITNEASPYDFAAQHKAGWYPPYAAQMLQRSESSRPRSQMLTLGANSRTQHNADVGDEDEIGVSLRCWMDDGTGSFEGHDELEQFVDELHDETGGGEPFSIYHGEAGAEEQWVVRFADAALSIVPARVAGAQANDLWQWSAGLVAEVAPW
ncbi:MAG: hypothetical protein CMK74_01015 [Pseudomonadales bacterium]|nr:hypothetical protein [Pseudomonadales bacterium]